MKKLFVMVAMMAMVFTGCNKAPETKVVDTDRKTRPSMTFEQELEFKETIEEAKAEEMTFGWSEPIPCLRSEYVLDGDCDIFVKKAVEMTYWKRWHDGTTERMHCVILCDNHGVEHYWFPETMAR